MKELPELESIALTEVKGFKKSYLLELLTLIALHQRKDEGEARLKAVYLKRVIPGYEFYLRFLIDLGVIRRSNHYVPGETSYNYTFMPDYQSRYEYFLVNDQYLINRIAKNNLRRHNTHKYSGQTRFIRKMSITDEAFNEIKNIETMEKYNAALSAALKIKQSDIYYSVDNTSGRFHSNLTNLPEYLRPFIRIDGKQLTNIDITNSQPYFSTLLLTNPGRVSRFAKSEKLFVLLQSLEVVDTMDGKMYAFLVFKGKLYEFLIEKGFAQNRKEAKRQLFVIMFGPGSYWSKRHEIFEKWFPSVYERFCIVKGHSRGNKFESYKRFAILLQTIEAHVVLDTILPRIYKEHPGTIAVTIHDSVMTSILTDDVKTVKKIMEEELKKFVGHEPTLKIENFDLNSLNLSTSKDNKEDIEGGICYTITMLQTL